MKKKKNYLWTILVIPIALGGFYYVKTQNSSALPTSTEAHATQGDLIIGFESDGTSTLPFSNLDFEVSGKLSELLVSAGDTLTPGQIVAKIDPSTYQKAYDSAKISYEKAQINYQLKVDSNAQSLANEADKLQTLKQQYNSLNKDYQDMLTLKETYAQSELEAKMQSVNDAKRAYDLAKATHLYNQNSTASITLEKLNLETAKMQLDEAKANLDKTVLKANSAGQVLNVGKAIGDNVSASSDTGSLSASSSHLVVYSNATAYQVTTSVSEQDLPLVTLGQKVTVVFDALEGKSYLGKVIHIDKLPSTDNSGIVTYEVIAELDSGFEEIGIGMTATVTFIQKEALGVIIVPNKAVTMENGVQYVTVKGQDGTLTKTAIKAGLTDGRNAAVTEGLNGNETLVITSQAPKAE